MRVFLARAGEKVRHFHIILAGVQVETLISHKNKISPCGNVELSLKNRYRGNGEKLADRGYLYLALRHRDVSAWSSLDTVFFAVGLLDNETRFKNNGY